MKKNEIVDLVIKNGKIVNVFTGEIHQGDVAIQDGVIVGIGEYKGRQEMDVSGKFVSPAFVDAHLHLESTLVKPQELICAAAQKGTTTFIVDPHEAANVSGVEGINFIIEQTENVPANVFIMIPSCVPAMDIEDNGATITANIMRQYLQNPRVKGLGEVMDCNAVIQRDKSMMEKLEVFRDKIIDGHAGYLKEKELMSYKLAGIQTDHECCDYETAIQEAQVGLQVLIREGTAAKNLDDIVKGLVKNKVSLESFCFCTDDKDISEIIAEGHISYNVKRSIELGISSVDAIRMASIYAARTYELKDIGAVAPGYQADLLIISDLENFEIEKVFYKGKDVEKYKAIEENKAINPKLLDTVHIGDITLDDFQIKSDKTTFPIIHIVEGQILTKKSDEAVEIKDGMICLNEEYNKVMVIERHKASGKKAVGIVKGFHLKCGAIASTFGHDSHNLIVVGDNDRDMFVAVKELERCGGGFTIVKNSQVEDTLELRIMGLISMQGNQEVEKKLSKMVEMAHKMGVPQKVAPFITLAFLALPVIPEIRITTRGIYDVLEKKFIE